MAVAHSPARLGPMHDLHLRAGAQMADIAGWQLPMHYGDPAGEAASIAESTGVCDITGKTVARLKSVELDDVMAEFMPRGDVPAIGRIARHPGGLAARLTAEEAFLNGPPSAAASSMVPPAPDGGPLHYVIDITSGLAGLKIAGSRAVEALNALTDLDLRDASMPDMSCAQAGFAQVHGTLLRVDAASGPAYELYVAREYGAYIWEAMRESLGPGGITPFGHAALERLEQARSRGDF